MKRRIAALLLCACLCLTGGCARQTGAAVLCLQEGETAARALCSYSSALSYASASSDTAALQQMESGQCDFALVTEKAMRKAEADGFARVDSVLLGAFHILTRTGAVSAWDKTTRVVIVGKKDGYADKLAQQVLSCALYGTVRYQEEDALQAFRRKRADVVMGLFLPGDAAVAAALKKTKNASLTALPESLVSIRLPDESMGTYSLTIGQETVSTYALYGAVAAKTAKTGETVRAAVDQADLRVTIWPKFSFQ